MAINFGALLRYAPAAAQGLGAYRKGAMAGEMQREAQERADAAALFEQFAKRRQLELQQSAQDQRTELRSMQDAANLERERMRNEAALEKANLQNKVDWFEARSRFGREGDQNPIGQPERIATERNRTQVGMNDADNAAAMARAMLAAQVAAQRIAAQEGRKAQQGGDRTAKAEERLSGAWGREQTVKNATEIASRLSQMKAAGEGPAGDLSLIFGYMKILDPTSVVREGEQASAANARGVPDAIRNLHNRILRGDKLTPRQRQEFVAEATKLAQAQRATMDPIKRRFGALARNYDADSATVVSDPYETVLDKPGTITFEEAMAQMRARKKP